MGTVDILSGGPGPRDCEIPTWARRPGGRWFGWLKYGMEGKIPKVLVYFNSL